MSNEDLRFGSVTFSRGMLGGLLLMESHSPKRACNPAMLAACKISVEIQVVTDKAMCKGTLITQHLFLL
jgi:hypothetical protein